MMLIFFEDAGSFSRMVWLEKYGNDFEMNQSALLNFIRSENVELKGTVFSLFEVAEMKKLPEDTRKHARNVINAFLSNINLKVEDGDSINKALRVTIRTCYLIP